MTLQEMLEMPLGMGIDEYNALIKRKHYLSARIRTVSDQIQDCYDALEILQDETGSERWCKWDAKLADRQQALVKLFKKFDDNENKIRGDAHGK